MVSKQMGLFRKQVAAAARDIRLTGRPMVYHIVGRRQPPHH